MQMMLSLSAALVAVLASRATAASYGYGDDDPTPPTPDPAPTPPITGTPPPPPPPPVRPASCGAADSFDCPEPLAQWTLDINDDAAIPPIAVFCTGDLGGEPADYTYNGVVVAGRTNTFTDRVDEAADGKCALRVRAGGLKTPAEEFYNYPYPDYATTATNSASRTFTVTNAGCGATAATSFTLSVAVTYDVKDLHSSEYVDFLGQIPYLYDGNDRAMVTVTVSGVETAVAEVTSASAIRELEPYDTPIADRDYGVLIEFTTFTADLGDVAPGESLEVTVTVSAANERGCGAESVVEDSVIVIDDIRIEPRF